MTKAINLLYIEDNRFDQMAFERLVKQDNLDYRYSFANSAAEALAILQEPAFDMVLLDYQLGDGTGLEILEQISAEIPTIFITGFGNEAVAVQAIKAGAIDYMVKDINHHYLKILPLRIETAIRHVENERLLRRLQKEQFQMGLLRDFVQNISHDMRTPLTGLVLAAELIQRYVNKLAESPQELLELRPKLIDRAQKIQFHVQKLNTIVEKALQIVRLDMLEALELRPEDLSQIARAILNRYEHASQQQEINLLGEIITQPAMILGVGEEIGNLMIQLIDNALRFTPIGGQIRISVYRQAEEICLEIADTGEGIAAYKLPHIFERLYLVDESRGGSSSGLGLTIVKRIADLHQARIKVESEINNGTTFKIYFLGLADASAYDPSAIDRNGV